MQTMPEKIAPQNTSTAEKHLTSVLDKLYAVSDEDLERSGSPMLAAEHTVFSMKQLNCRC